MTLILELWGFRKWEDDIIKLYFNDRSCDCWKYYDQWNGYHKIERKTSFKIQTRGLGFIFQDFNLLDTLTAFENIALALTIMKIPAREIEDRVRSIAEKLMITEVLNKYPYQMSGGQKQRVASARDDYKSISDLSG